MKIESAAASALLGIQRGLEGLERNAAEVAGTGLGRGERSPVDPLLESRTNQRQVEASVKVLKTADEMAGTLLDELA